MSAGRLAFPPPELVAHPDQLAAVHRSVVADGPAAGCRAIDVPVLGGIEPANCSVLGRRADRLAGRLPVLEPAEERMTTVEIRAEQRAPRE